MRKIKIFISILAVVTLLTLSFSSAVSSNTTKTVKKKESPLYGIRTRQSIGERLGKIIDFIKTRFLGERIFIIPFQWIIRYIRNSPSTVEATCPITCMTGCMFTYCPTYCKCQL